MPPLTRLLPAGEAARHAEAAHKYLYRGALVLLEAKDWDRLQTCAAAVLAVSAAGQATRAVQVSWACPCSSPGAAAFLQALHLNSHHCPLLQVITKLAPHAPPSAAASMLLAAAAQLCEASAQAAGSEASTELLSALAAAALRPTEGAREGGRAELWQAVHLCAASQAGGVLPLAGLLLPALAGPCSPAGWVPLTLAAIETVRSSLCSLHGAAAAAKQQASGQATLAAALPLAAAVRKAVGSRCQPETVAGAAESFGGGEAAEAAAAVLDLLPGLVGIGARCGAEAQRELFEKQAHAAAVAAVSAARLRAALIPGDPASAPHSESSVCDLQSIGWLLGWELGAVEPSW